MSDELGKLYLVQQTDTEIGRLKQAIAGLDTGAELQAEIAVAEEKLKALLDRHHNTEKEHLNYDLEMKSLEGKRKKFQEQLFGGAIHNPRQLADLQEEVQMLTREIHKLEDTILELMDQMEEERKEIGSRENQLNEQGERLRLVKEAYRQTLARLQGEVAQFEEKRAGLASQVGPSLLKRYEQIRARQHNLGLVNITGDVCPGCKIALPSERLKALKAGRRDQTCDNCGRILYYDEQTNAEINL